ncbi:MAG TPA: nitrilase-related carbon-nitrogen hydrolase, partial [Ramlibacter sp.]|nr:nitrilase-related carbon-nitrogen hydrolase [Ramlibacter sp.]
MALKLCIAQLNFLVGDMPGNAQKIIAAARSAYAQGARLVLTPELSICGYAAEDLFLRPAFIAACDDALKEVARELAGLKGLYVVVGHPTGGDIRSRSVAVQRRFNAASVVCEGKVLESYAKRELPNYQVFDEHRYFTPGQGTAVFQVEGVSVGILICEDAWFEEPALLARESGAELLVVVNASPFHVGKGGERIARMADRARAVGRPLVYAHLVGGQDEVVFDGGSFAVDADGTLAARAPSFHEEIFCLRAERAADGALKLAGPIAHERSPEAELWDALVMGVRDYVGKNGFPGVLLGLSGAIDSALVLAVAVDALGRDKVRAVM